MAQFLIPSSTSITFMLVFGRITFIIIRIVNIFQQFSILVNVMKASLVKSKMYVWIKWFIAFYDFTYSIFMIGKYLRNSVTRYRAKVTHIALKGWSKFLTSIEFNSISMLIIIQLQYLIFELDGIILRVFLFVIFLMTM